MTEREALKLALEALEEAADAIDSWGSYASGYFQVKHDLESDISKAKSAIAAIKEALAQPEQEPDYYGLTADHLWMSISKDHYDRLNPEYRMTCYTTPPQRKPLTDEEIQAIWPLRPTDSIIQFARAIEAAHGIKGGI